MNPVNASDPVAETVDLRGTEPECIDHQPSRDDAVAAWLKRQRDEYTRDTPVYWALDTLLDDYRLYADVGATLDTPIAEIGPHAEVDR